VASVGFSVAETARRVGVAGSTLRTWERRYGLQPSLRTAGGHRRYTVDDVAALQQLRRLVDAGLPTGSAAARMTAGETRVPRDHRPALTDRFAAAVQAIDREESTRLATRIVSQLGVVEAWTDVFVPHLQAAGNRWGESGHGTEREHLGTAAIQFALLRHHLNRGRPAPPVRVLAVATPEEGHTLPLDALAAGAADAGIGICVLGTLPAEGVEDAVADLQPAVVVVWARSRSTADLPLLRSLGRRVPVVCAAGPGWTSRRLPAGVAHVNDLPGALAALQTWIG
jgi:DNA-binding transcriptional MerR regulator